MPQGDKSADTDKQKRPTGTAARPEAQARPRPAANKLYGGGKKMNTGRIKVPFGPVGGRGRKTNLTRSS